MLYQSLRSLHFIVAIVVTCLSVAGQSVQFEEIADDGIGLDYARVPSAHFSILEGILNNTLSTPLDLSTGPGALIGFPAHPRGLPGVVLFDYDNDGDDDIYATNGPGAANSLFQNQLTEGGGLTFIDVAAPAGVEAVAQNSSGACAADIDNDGDRDLFVVGYNDGHHLFENQGNGTFSDITASSAFIAGGVGGTACAFGDLDNDSLVDLLIMRAWDHDSLLDCFTHAAATVQPNESYLNAGGNVFVNTTATSGILDLDGVDPSVNASITWAGSIVDFDLDGDAEIITADDQCAAPTANFPGFGGLDRGVLQIFENDGSGQLTATTAAASTDQPGAWMGLSFADFNHDGHMDFFATNFGDWFFQFFGIPFFEGVGHGASRWWLGGPGGGFADSEAGQFSTTPFGWGTSAEDLDNDGDTDITFLGTIDLQTNKDGSNAGVVLLNDGQANFTWESSAFETDHRPRGAHGVAAGDLDHDGRVDIVSVSNQDVQGFSPVVPYAAVGVTTGSPFDSLASFFPLLVPTAPSSTLFVWTGIRFDDGGISVERNTTSNSNGWVAVETLGTSGLTTGGAVNRDGIGAVVTVTPRDNATAMKPVLAGSSHLSQDSHRLHFGLGESKKGTIDVLWPGGTRNRLYDAKHGDEITFPEIPCSIDTGDSLPGYTGCVQNALDELVASGVLSPSESAAFHGSAVRAWMEEH